MAIGRRNGMVQMLHIPLCCDHSTCSISISTRKQLRLASPYIKLADLRSLGAAVHTSAFVACHASHACVCASHGSSGNFSLWQLPFDPCSSYARCSLCPCPSPFPSEAVASFCYRRSDGSICIVAARASGVEVWMYPPAAVARETAAAAACNGSDGVLVAAVASSPRAVTAMAALQFETAAGGGQQAAHFVIGHDDGSLRELSVDVWGSNVGGSVAFWELPPARRVTERYAVKFVQPWHHGSCLFVCAWADGCVQVFGTQGGWARPVSEAHRLSPGIAAALWCHGPALM